MDDSDEIDVKSFMSARLPEYVVRCFLAAGFDTLDVIAAMDTSANPGNSIAVIESFIDKYYCGHKDFYPNSVPTTQQPFIFPPGHRLRISNFISDIKRKHDQRKLQETKASSKRKFASFSKPLSKKAKAENSDTDSECDTIVSVSKQIRVSIAKWARNQSCNVLRQLKENKDFTMVVTNTPKSDELLVSIRCNACNTRIQLAKRNKNYPISNWTRHMKTCKKLHKKEDSKQEILAKFWSPEPATSSSSGNISDLSREYHDASSPLTDHPLPGLEINDSFMSDISGVDEISPINHSEISSDHSEQISTSPAIQITSPNAEQIAKGRATKKANTVIDWSRFGRNKKMLENIGCADAQTHIPDYYTIIEDIDRLALENKRLTFLLQQEATEVQPSKISITGILKQIVSNAEKNAQRLPTGRRHSEVIKKFATSLFIYAGPSAYNFLQVNLDHALPSLRTVQRTVRCEYKTMNEGEFRFDDLIAHLSQHKAPKVITIGEDATRVIARVQYDSETNRCVGFVLPLTETGLPKMDSFLALTFEGMEKMFSDNCMAKYAYVYIAQPLCENVPSFCLACFGTDNKFTAKEILLRWQHILKECNKRDVMVVSVGGDGDSRLMKAMRSCAHLFAIRDESLSSCLPTPFSKLSVPLEWKEWFHVDASTLACVQDMVHVAVKLKCRLIKPSSLLPMGNYVAGIQHLRMLQEAFGKDEHGLRERDINHKDKQNFSAVLNIIRASPLLDNIPDAPATKQYIDVMQCIMDAFLDKALEPLVRIEKMWYALLFLRYWRQWICLHPLYTLQSNFITQNAYLCIELNAHSIITFLMTIRDHFDSNTSYFLPWMLGSQSCEKVFRLARSMTSTFSTVINFGMLGLLRRLHRLQIQSRLQSEETGIVYPQILKHESKDRKNTFKKNSSFDCLTDAKICEAIVQANLTAKARVESLGMLDLLKDHKVWTTIPSSADILSNDEEDSEDSDEDADSAENPSEEIIASIIQESSTECSLDIEADIKTLQVNKIINSEVEVKLSKLQKCLPKFKKVGSDSIPVYNVSNACDDITSSPFVEVTLATGSQVFVRKTTVLWLFQEGERVSSDRLFRVRAKQPFSSDTKYEQKNASEEEPMPVVRANVNLGEICAFVQDGSWSLGKVLQFSKYKNKTVSSQQYKGLSASVSKDDIGVLCSWFPPLKGSTNTFQICHSKSTEHTYIPISCYLCTITSNCLQVVQTSDYQSKSVMHCSSSYKKIVTAEQIQLPLECQAFITNCLRNTCTDKEVTETAKSLSEFVHAVDSESKEGKKPLPKMHVTVDLDCKEGKQLPKWTRIGHIILYESDRAVLLNEEEWINDIHIAGAQTLLKQQFPELSGFDSTLNHESGSLKPLPPNSLQVIHIDGNHWAAVSTINCKNEDIIIYDSLYSGVNTKTQLLLARLLHTSKPAFLVRVAHVTKQSGASACGLFAIAYITDIAFGRDPEHHVFNQSEMRRHLYRCIEQHKMEPFPVSREKRASNVCKPIQVDVHCYCRCPEYGMKMVLCNGVCGEHYHMQCIEFPVNSKKWYCKNCVC